MFCALSVFQGTLLRTVTEGHSERDEAHPHQRACRMTDVDLRGSHAHGTAGLVSVFRLVLG